MKRNSILMILGILVIVLTVGSSIVIVEKNGQTQKKPDNQQDTEKNSDISLLKEPPIDELAIHDNLPKAAYTLQGNVASIEGQTILIQAGAQSLKLNSVSPDIHVYQAISGSRSLKSISHNALRKGDTVTVEVVVQGVYTRVIKYISSE